MIKGISGPRNTPTQLAELNPDLWLHTLTDRDSQRNQPTWHKVDQPTPFPVLTNKTSCNLEHLIYNIQKNSFFK
jgi:hypothetical protein